METFIAGEPLETGMCVELRGDGRLYRAAGKIHRDAIIDEIEFEIGNWDQGRHITRRELAERIYAELATNPGVAKLSAPFPVNEHGNFRVVYRAGVTHLWGRP